MEISVYAYDISDAMKGDQQHKKLLLKIAISLLLIQLLIILLQRLDVLVSKKSNRTRLVAKIKLDIHYYILIFNRAILNLNCKFCE